MSIKLTIILLLGVLLWLLTAKQEPTKRVVIPEKIQSIEVPPERIQSTVEPPDFEPNFSSDNPGDLVESIHMRSDDQLPAFLMPLINGADKETAVVLLPIVYEEILLRRPDVKLRLFLELARHPHCEEGLRTTLLADLGVALEQDYAHSWGEWAQALEEHFAEEYGLIRESHQTAD